MSAIATMEQNAGLGGDTDPDVDVLRGLTLAVRTVLAKGLHLLGMSAPERM